MRTDSRQVAHLWANQSCDEAHGSAHIRCSKDTLYSYAEPIGRIVKATADNVALFRDRDWSVTTARHQKWMRRAASHLVSFTVAEIAPVSHSANIAHYRHKIDALAARRQTHLAIAGRQALINEANCYCETFGLATRFAFDDPRKVRERLATRMQRDAANHARRERAQRAAAQERLNTELAKLPKWFEGKGPVPQLPTQYARIDGDVVTTTLGAQCPLEHAKRAAKLVRRILASGKAWQSNGHTIHLGDFAVDYVDEAGCMRAGCHLFERAEVERLASILA